MKKKNESAISKQTDEQRKMNACWSFEKEHLSSFSLIPVVYAAAPSSPLYSGMGWDGQWVL